MQRVSRRTLLCRHALADFGPVLRQRVLRLFQDSLTRSGVLCLDGQMPVADAYAGTYQAIQGETPLYKRGDDATQPRAAGLGPRLCSAHTTVKEAP
jgi:hypothetical protein